jgi:hypothetical protein
VTDPLLNITWQGFTPSEPHYVIYYLEQLAPDGKYAKDYDKDIFDFTQG